MGNCAELCAERHDISRESLDAHAIESYKRAERAWKEGAFDAEVVPVAKRLSTRRSRRSSPRSSKAVGLLPLIHPASTMGPQP